MNAAHASRRSPESVNAANAQQWITYAAPIAIEYMSFNVPTGVPDDQKCGRAVYSDLHAAGNSPLTRELRSALIG